MEDVVEIPVNLTTEGFEKGSQKIKDAVRSMGNETEKFGKSASESASRLGKGFSAAGNMAKSFSQTIKNSIKTIIGIGTAYQIISKSVSAYMSQNQKLSQQMNSVWTAFGNLLGPIIERIIGLVTSAVSYLLSFMKLLGLTSKSASQLSKSAKGAGGSIQATVAGFDELNKLQDGGGGGGGAGLEDKDPTEWMKKIQELIAGKQWENLGEEIGRKLTEFIVGIPSKISQLIKKVDWKEVGRAIVGIVKGFFKGFNVRDIMDSLVALAHDIWNAFLDVLWGAMEDESGEEPPLVKSLRALGDAVEELYTTIMDSWEKDIKPVLVEAYEAVIKPILDWLTDEALPWLIDKITALVKLISDYWPVIQPILIAFAATIAGFGIATKISGVIKIISGPLMAALKTLFAFLAANPLVLIITLIVSIIAYLVHLYKTNDEFREKVDTAWAAIKNAIGTAVDWIKDKFQAFKDKIAEVRQKIIDFKDKAAESFNNIKTKVSQMWDKIKEVFSFEWKLPHIKLPHLEVTWQPAGDLAKFFGFSHVPSVGINWYKKGGIVDGAQLIGAGEDGKEAIVPLERNTEWINMVADGLISRLESRETKLSNGIAALEDIAKNVQFSMPAVAAGTVTPYSVSAASGYSSSTDTDSEILRLIESLYELLERFVTGMDNMQFVAEFEDLRALAKRITREQRRQTISEGM